MLTVPNAKDSDKATLVQVRIHDGNEWHEFGNYGQHERVFGVELSANIDNPIWTCDRLEFRNRSDLGPSLDPNDTSSDFNDGTIADTLLSPKHRVEVILSKDDFSTQVVKFRGAVGPITGRRTVDKDDVITVSPLDQAQPLKEPIIEGIDPTKQQPYIYNDIWIEDLIDEIVQLKGHNISLDRTNSDIPDFLVNEMKLKGITPWKAASNVAEKVGHKLIFRTPSVSDGKQLLLFDPQRGVEGRRLEQDDPEWTVDDTIKGGYDVRETEEKQQDVRTACRVHYVDEKIGQTSVFVKDEQALQDYGARDYNGGQMHRTMVLKEDDKSQISTETEARNYAHYALGDVNAPTTSVDYGLRYCHPGIQLYDLIRWEGVPDYDVEMAVNSISLSIGYERQEGDTQVSGTVKRVRGSRKYWTEMGHLPDTIDEYRGDQKPPPVPEDPPALTKENYIDDTKSEKAKVLCEGEHNPAKDVVGYRWRFREIIDGEKEPWQHGPDTGEPTTVLRGLDVGKNIELEVQYQAEDFETTYPNGLDGDGGWSPVGRVSLYPDTMPPAPPVLDKANGNEANLELFWTPPSENKDGTNLRDLDEHIVYLKEGADPTKDDYDIKQEAPGDKFAYNSGATGATYHCGVTAVDKVGNESELSNIKEATVENITTSDDPTTYDDSFKDVQVGDAMIGFQFNTPNDWQGFSHWELQRSKDGGNYSVVWEGNGVAHLDKNLDTSASYEYKLFGVGQDGNKSGGSTTGPYTPDNSDNSNLLTNVFMADIIVGTREVRAKHVEIGSLSAIQSLTGNIKTGSSGARVEIFPDSDTGLEVLDDNENPVFQALVGGTNIGDVIMGNPTGEHARWDKDQGQYEVRGRMTIVGGSGIGNLTDAGSLAEQDDADWGSDVTGTNKPADNATVGAIWGTNLDSIPDRHTDSAVTGLNLTSTHLGYYDGSVWQAYIGSDGGGQLAGGDISWSETGNVAVEGSMVITGGSGIGNLSDAGIMAEYDPSDINHTGASAPSNPDTGWLWRDTDTTSGHDELKRYNGTSWDVIGTLNTGDLADKNAAKVSDSTLYIDGDLTVTGNLKMAGGDVQLGASVPDGAGGTREGLYIKNGGGYIEDSAGRVILDSNGKFISIPDANDMNSLKGSARIPANSWETVQTISNSDAIFGGLAQIAKGTHEEQKLFRVRIVDGAGTVYIEHPTHINDSYETGYGAGCQTDPGWGNPMITLPFPTLQVQGSADIEIYNGADGGRNCQWTLWYS